MNQQIHIDHKLFLEIKRYLAAVDLYRAEHCEPTWRLESTPYLTSDALPWARAEYAPSAH